MLCIKEAFLTVEFDDVILDVGTGVVVAATLLLLFSRLLIF